MNRLVSQFGACLRGLARGATDLLFPPQCIFCAGGGEEGSRWEAIGSSWVCPKCIKENELALAEPACPTCAAPAELTEIRDASCPSCRKQGSLLAGAVRLGLYQSSVGNHLRALKYQGREELAQPMALQLARSLHRVPWLVRVEVVTAVPSHWTRRIARPVRILDLITREVAEAVDRPLLPLLRRVRGGPHQVGLSYPQRVLNVRGAFALRNGVELRDARVLIVDDVMTTGATVEECARVLRRGGAAEVFAAVIARVDFDPETGRMHSGV